jgi:hypothetical protein
VAAPDELAIKLDRAAFHTALVERRKDLENMHTRTRRCGVLDPADGSISDH